MVPRAGPDDSQDRQIWFLQGVFSQFATLSSEMHTFFLLISWCHFGRRGPTDFDAKMVPKRAPSEVLFFGPTHFFIFEGMSLTECFRSLLNRFGSILGPRSNRRGFCRVKFWVPVHFSVFCSIGRSFWEPFWRPNWLPKRCKNGVQVEIKKFGGSGSSQSHFWYEFGDEIALQKWCFFRLADLLIFEGCP